MIGEPKSRRDSGQSNSEFFKERRRRVKRNASQISLYLDNWEQIHRSSAGSEVPCGKEAKGMRQYVAPISERGFFFLDDAGNEVARFWLEEEILPKMRRKKFPHFYACGLVAGWIAPQHRAVEEPEETQQEIKRCKKEGKEEFEARKKRAMEYREQEQARRKKNEEYLHSGIPRAKLGVPSNEEGHHGILREWKAQASIGSPGALAVFEAACLWAAEQLPDDIELDVSVEGGRQTANLRQAAAQDRQDKQKKGYARSHHIRYANFRKLKEEYPDATREALKATWSDRYGMSVPTIRDSLRFCERHRWPDGSVVAKDLRWPRLCDLHCQGEDTETACTS